jgi:hypothetical protein
MLYIAWVHVWVCASTRVNVCVCVCIREGVPALEPTSEFVNLGIALLRSRRCRLGDSQQMLPYPFLYFSTLSAVWFHMGRVMKPLSDMS